MGTEIEVAQVTNALAQFDKVGLGLAELEKSYKGVVYQVREKEGMKAAVAARRAIREPRIAVEKLRKEAKAPILALGRKLDSEAERITRALESLENPIDEQIKNEEMRLHNEAVAKAAAERQRVEQLEARLDSIRLMPFDAGGLDSKAVCAILDEARTMVIGDDWQEFKEKAVAARIASVAALQGVLAKAEAAEAEAARIIAERAELERLRKEAAERDAEVRKAQEAENARIAAEQKAERARLAAEKAELERIEAQRQADAKAEQDRLDAARRELEEAQAQLAASHAERTRIDAVGFRAHFERMTSAQRDQLRALSDASPTVDVWALQMPKDEPPIVLIDEPAPAVVQASRPSDAEIVQCVCERFGVDIDTAESWLIDLANRSLSERAA
jgi:colicin import membrane protein